MNIPERSNLLMRSHMVTALACVLLVSSCSREPSVTELKERRQQDSTDSVTKAHLRHVDSVMHRFPRIGLTKTVIKDGKELSHLRATYAKTTETWKEYRALTLLNRKDIQYYRVGDTVMIPDTIVEDLRAYSLFPQWYPEAEDIPKIVLISNKWQCYACYDHGELVRFAAVNSGEEHKPTFPGRYAVNWKSKLRLSSLDSTWRLPFTVNFHLYAGSAMHQFDMPGRPVSHSCVRQFLTDAEWMFKFVRTAKLDSNKRFIPMTGTPVIILDIFDFSRRNGGPWRDITSTKDVVIALPKRPLEVEEALIPISQIPKDVRGGLPNRKRYVEAESILRERGVIREQARLRESINYNKLRREKARKKAHAHSTE